MCIYANAFTFLYFVSFLLFFNLDFTAIMLQIKIGKLLPQLPLSVCMCDHHVYVFMCFNVHLNMILEKLPVME